ncbi:hypothetical protein HKCCE2091_20790 [Rhodobacterales bacterium HKCCE2091]|nr:hypothetical protein [Rhodobacterales bacterium HKCCE2091]
MPNLVITASAAGTASIGTPAFAATGASGNTVTYTLAADPPASGATIDRRVVALVAEDDYLGSEQVSSNWSGHLDPAQTIPAFIGGSQAEGASNSYAGLPPGTYYLVAQFRDTSFDPWLRSAWSAGIAVTVTNSDTTAPTIAPGTIAPAATTVTLPVSTDEAGGTIFWRVDPAATLSAAQVAAGGGTASGSQSVASAGAQAALVAGSLSPESSYHFHVFHRDAAGNESAVASVAFTTQAAATGELTLTEYQADGVPFASGEHLGRLTATIPFAGTGTDGVVVEARVVMAVPGLGTVPVTGWNTVATVSGGTWSGSLEVPWWPEALTREVRSQASPGNVLTAARSFEIAETVYSIGQSEDAHIWNTSLSNTTPDALIDYREALVAALTRHGRTGLYRPTTKRIGTDPLPAGVTQLDALTWEIGPGYDETVPFEDWSMVDASGQACELRVSKSGVTVRNCYFSIANHSGNAPNVAFRISDNASGVSIEYCEVQGRPSISVANMSEGRMAAAFRHDQNGGGATATAGTGNRFYRCRAYNLTDDGYKSAGARIIECVYTAPSNIPAGLPDYASGTTYAAGAAVRVAQVASPAGPRDYHYYVSNQNGNQGNAVSQSAWWTRYDPHADPFNYFACLEGSLCAGNIIDLTPDPAYLPPGQHAATEAIGTQSGLFITPNSSGPGAASPFRQLVITGNLLLGFTRGLTDPFDVGRSNSVSWTPPVCYNNWITPSERGNADRKYFFIASAGDAILGQNFDHATGAQIPDPRNATVSVGAIDHVPANRVRHVTLDIVQNNSGPADIGTAGDIVEVICTGTGTGTGAAETAALIKMTNTLNAESPLRRFVIAHSTWPGTDPTWVADDGNSLRRSSNEVVIRDAAFGDAAPAILTSSWFAAPGTFRSAYGDALAPVFLGVKADGTPYANPHVYTTHGSGSASMPMDFSWADLVDYAGVTRYAPRGPHQFIAYSNEVESNNRDKQMCRLSWRATTAGLPGRCLPPALEAVNYRQGDNSSPSNGGPTHPNNRHKEGLEWKAALDALAFAQSLGICRVPTPEFDRIAWAADGSHVEIWSSAGPVATTAMRRGDPALPGTHPHYTGAMGFRIGPDNDDNVNSAGHGVLAQNVTVVNGRIRIQPNGGSFANGDTIGFGNFGGQGDDGTNYPADPQNNIHRHLPVLDADAGPYNGPGLPLRPMPQAVSLVAAGIS